MGEMMGEMGEMMGEMDEMMGEMTWQLTGETLSHT